MMRDRLVMAETLATKDGDANGFTGKKELLVESEMYTFAFSEALAKIVQAQLWMAGKLSLEKWQV